MILLLSQLPQPYKLNYYHYHYHPEHFFPPLLPQPLSLLHLFLQIDQTFHIHHILFGMLFLLSYRYRNTQYYFLSVPHLLLFLSVLFSHYSFSFSLLYLLHSLSCVNELFLLLLICQFLYAYLLEFVLIGNVR